MKLENIELWSRAGQGSIFHGRSASATWEARKPRDCCLSQSATHGEPHLIFSSLFTDDTLPTNTLTTRFFATFVFAETHALLDRNVFLRLPPATHETRNTSACCLEIESDRLASRGEKWQRNSVDSRNRRNYGERHSGSSTAAAAAAEWQWERCTNEWRRNSEQLPWGRALHPDSTGSPPIYTLQLNSPLQSR